jgi:predicted membrane chloride channel (bestrophin family)
MIVFNHNDMFSSLWWAHGSAIPSVGWLSLICAINGVIAVYFKKVFSFYLTNTPHTIMATTVGVLLVFKSGLGKKRAKPSSF